MSSAIPHPHFRTGNYLYPLPCAQVPCPFTQATWIRPLILSFPPTTSWLWALFPCPLCWGLSRPDRTGSAAVRSRKAVLTFDLGAQDTWASVSSAPREGRCPEVLGRRTPNFQWCPLACLSQRARGAQPRRGSTEKLKFCLVLGIKPTPMKNPYIPEWASVKKALWVGKELSGLPDMFCMWVVVSGVHACGEVHWSVLLTCRSFTLCPCQ